MSRTHPTHRYRRGAAALAAVLLGSGLNAAYAAPSAPSDQGSDTAVAADNSSESDSAALLAEPQQHEPNHFGSSPFTPREATDSLFVVDESPGLDTGCTFRSSGPLEFDIEVDRVLGDADRDRLVSNGLLPQFASLRMPAYDVDFDAVVPPYNPERDRVLFNGQVVQEEWLTGENDVWKMNQFLVPIEWVEFAADPGAGGTPEPVVNTITIEIDTANTDELWCTSIDWAELSFTMPRPTVFAHGIFSSHDIWLTPWSATLQDAGIYTHDTLDMGALDSIANNADKIGVAVEETRERYGVDSVNMVVHSKGGLDSRHYVESHEGVDRIVQLGTPNAGSPLADLAQGIVVSVGGIGGSLIGGLAAPAGVQLTTPYMWLYNNTHALSPEVDFTVMAGDYSATGCPLTLDCLRDRFLLQVTGQGDTIVPLWSAHRFASMLQHTYASSGQDKDATHGGLHHSDAILDLLSPTVEQPGTDDTGAVFSTQSASIGPTAEGPVGQLPQHTATVVGLTAAGPGEHEVPIDASSPTFVSVLYTAGAAVTVELVSPSGDRITPSTPGVEFEDSEMEGSRLAVYHLPSPEVGTWTVEVGGGSATTAYAIHAWPSETDVSLTVELPEPSVASGEAVTVHATLTDGATALTGAQLSATVLRPDDTSVEVALADDGLGADATAGDGIYSTTLTTGPVGMYRLGVVASGDTADGTPFSREVFALATASSGQATVGTITDQGVDTNGNGLYDELQVSMQVDVDATGTYRVFGELTDSDGNVEISSTVVDLPAGTSPVVVSFDGATIYDAGVDGPYTLSQLRITEESELALMPVTDLTDAHTTGAYGFAEFEHSGLRLTGVGTAQGVDLDSNGLFDQLAVTVQVHADAAGYYEWSGQLRSPAGTELDFESGAANFTVGTNDLTFVFDGWAVGDSGEDGPYRITDVLLFGAGHNLVAGEAYETPHFTASQFEGYRGEVERIAGANRYETAGLIAQAAPAGSAEVLVASGEVFPDALAMSAAAGAAPGPLLLTRAGSVPLATSAEIQRRVTENGPQALGVAGGREVIHAATVEALSALAGTDAETHFGSDRYATAAAIAAATVAPGATSYVVSGLDYPDALTAATLAAPEQGSVLLTRPGALPSATITQLTAQAPQRIVVVGGTDSVSDDVLAQLQDYAPVVERLSGDDRYATAAAVSDTFDPVIDVLYVATGENYPDALTVAALAGQQGAPVLLTQTGSLPAVAAAAADRLDPDRIIVVGGTESVSDAVLEQLEAYLN
ncbi:cell wall-binding repeat-containing protein [Ornithinimicrobium cryptoxanthini]|uniref:cell wall-binding repeat-containing protein n=1 Tax=Ornithinimicrobium cryptoxanthini TaxID=2934161 RepID=UPI00211944DB|nr:cell wall-binding repeat-containing protein [Ornithinimicrobium cryptoxanthini]